MARIHGKSGKMTEYGDCIYCGGLVEAQKRRLVYEYQDQLFIFQNVEMGICKQCNEQFISAQTAKKLEEMASTPDRQATMLAVPVLNAET
jgi:YgiT-type zinc finger domain-containing protein